jgi:paraquat-inducible protein B
MTIPITERNICDVTKLTEDLNNFSHDTNEHAFDKIYQKTHFKSWLHLQVDKDNTTYKIHKVGLYKFQDEIKKIEQAFHTYRFEQIGKDLQVKLELLQLKIPDALELSDDIKVFYNDSGQQVFKEYYKRSSHANAWIYVEIDKDLQTYKMCPIGTDKFEQEQIFIQSFLSSYRQENVSSDLKQKIEKDFLDRKNTSTQNKQKFLNAKKEEINLAITKLEREINAAKKDLINFKQEIDSLLIEKKCLISTVRYQTGYDNQLLDIDLLPEDQYSSTVKDYIHLYIQRLKNNPSQEKEDYANDVVMMVDKDQTYYQNQIDILKEEMNKTQKGIEQNSIELAEKNNELRVNHDSLRKLKPIRKTIHEIFGAIP